MSDKEDTLKKDEKLVADDGSGVEIVYKGPKNEEGKYWVSIEKKGKKPVLKRMTSADMHNPLALDQAKMYLEKSDNVPFQVGRFTVTQGSVAKKPAAKKTAAKKSQGGKRRKTKRHGKVGGGQTGCMNEIMELYNNEPEIIDKYAQKIRKSSLEGMPKSFSSFKRLFDKKYKDYKTLKGGTRRNRRRDWGRAATEMGARAVFFLMVLLFIFNIIQIARGLNFDGSPNPGNRILRLYRFLADPTGLSDLFRITPRMGGSRKKSGGVHVIEPFEKCDGLWKLLDESKKDPIAFGKKKLHIVKEYADKDTLSFYKEVLEEGESKIKKGRGRSLSGGQGDDDLLYIWVTGVTGLLVWYFIETGPPLFGGKRRKTRRRKRGGEPHRPNTKQEIMNKLGQKGYKHFQTIQKVPYWNPYNKKFTAPRKQIELRFRHHYEGDKKRYGGKRRRKTRRRSRKRKRRTRRRRR